MNARFKNVSCSNCGHDFGPGDHGYSHCEDHEKEMALVTRLLNLIMDSKIEESLSTHVECSFDPHDASRIIGLAERIIRTRAA